MAIFNEINKHSKVVGIIIGVGLLFFILGNEFFGQNSIFSRSKNNVGEIAGTNIDLDEYRQKLSQSELDYQIRTGKSVGESERASIQEMAWNQLISKYVVEPQYDKLGLGVSKEELVDMVQGKNIHATVKQLFTNPQTQQFDKSFLTNFLQNFDKQEPRNQQLWTNIESSLPIERLRNKYLNLLKMTNYVTKEESKREYANQNDKLDIKFVYVNYSALPDSSIQISDDEIKQYINNHKNQYEVEEGRSIDFVSFNILPSAKDSAIVIEELGNLTSEFKSTDNDSLFIANNSDNPSQLSYKSIGELPEELKTSRLTTDSVYGPYLQSGKYSLYKITKTKADSTYSMRASHILFKATPGIDGDGKADAAKRANEILAKIKSGASFEEMARIHGTDGTASRGGDLGWFSEGQMVKPFNDAVLNAKSAGLLPTIVATDFGYHIIKITAPKTNLKYQIGLVERDITASEETKDAIFKKADDFAAQNKDTASFYAALAKDPSLMKQSADNFKKTDSYVSSINNPREMIRWAYNDAKVGQVSKVFIAENQYYVVALKGSRDKGVADVESVRNEVSAKIRNEKKAQVIITKLKAQTGTLENIASKYGKEAISNIASDINFSAGSITGLGYDPVAVGVAFGIAKGKRSSPFIGENGVGIIEVANVNKAAEVADYTSYKTQLKQLRTGKEDYVVDNILKKQANIEDNRYKFF
ncbi:MAG: peptidylprolyl isomerase [Cytophagales bacterium]|nr:MAG: peptidylprolyl isomerase [Cytophagales bacterium]